MLKSQMKFEAGYRLAVGVAVIAALLSVSGCGKKVDSEAGNLVVPERAGVFTSATQYYGPLRVSETPDTGIYTEADTKPWSGYWYPISDDLLIAGSDRNGGQCTLDKYDRYAKQVFGKAATSVDYERKYSFIVSNEIGWEGRCNAWAFASVMEPEPVLSDRGVGLEGMTFYTRDVKALVIKSYELIDEKSVLRFGQRYNGPDDDADDIYPDQFHTVLQAELFEKHRPVLMDSDRKEQVWNKPIWKANITMKRDAQDQHIMHVWTDVSATMSEAIPMTDSPWDYVGTQNKVFNYTYDLYGIPQPDGKLLVKYGKWTGASKYSHPDFVTALPAKGKKIPHRSKNEQLDRDVISDILVRTGLSSL